MEEIIVTLEKEYERLEEKHNLLSSYKDLVKPEDKETKEERTTISNVLFNIETQMIRHREAISALKDLCS